MEGYKFSLWERFVDWMVRDAYALEERALLKEQARRLKLATDLQEQRIKERQKRQEERRKDFRTVAVWKVNFTQNGTEYVAQFYLQQTPTVDGSRYRRVIGGPSTMKGTGRLFREKTELDGFFRGQGDFIEYVLPWHEFSIPTEGLKSARRITVLRK